MKHQDISTVKPNPGSFRIVAAIVILLIVAAVAFATSLPSVQKILSNPGILFSGDDSLRQAASDLTSADSRLRTNPGDEDAHLLRARSYIVLGHIEGVQAEWQQYHLNGLPEWGDVGREIEELRLKTEEIRAMLYEAETSASPADNYPPIYTLLDDISERFTGIPRYRALFLKGYLLIREGRRAEAEPIFAGDLQNYPLLEDYVDYYHARSLDVSGNEDNALQEYEDFLADYPSSRLAPLVHLERINILRNTGVPDLAIEECNRAIDRYPTSDFAPKVLRKLAEIYEDSLDFDSGAPVRVRILDEYPESEEADGTIEMFFDGVYSTGLLSAPDRLIVAVNGVEEYASEAFEILVELAESDSLTPEERARAAYGAGLAEYYQGHYYECIDHETRARELAPGSEWADRAGIRTGRAYMRLDKYDRAKEMYQQVIDDHGALASLAAEILYETAYGQGDLDAVDDACRIIVDEYPSSDECPAAMTILAYLGCRNGQYQSARGYAERCIAAFPDNPASGEATFWLARALTGLGRTAEAGNTYNDLSRKLPWDYWGIRAAEIDPPEDLPLESVDIYTFLPETLSCFDGNISTAWELYNAGTLDLALSEFRYALKSDVHGAQAGIALILGEQEEYHNGILALRASSAIGDQAFLTPDLQKKLLSVSFIKPYHNEVVSAALAHDVPPSWLWGTMRQESAYKQRAHSGSGARGLIQIMPQTGHFIAAQRGADTFDPDTLWNPATNLDYSAWYFSYLRDEVGSGNLLEILAAYNGGPGRLRTYKNQLPTRDIDIFISAIPREETRNFAHWVYANVRMYDRILEESDFQLVPF